MKSIITLVLTTSITLNAIACDNAVILKVGDTVKDCDRVGLSLEYNKSVTRDLIEGDYNKKIIEEQEKILSLKDLSIELNQQRSELWRQDAERERKLLDEEKSKGSRSLWIGIAVGVLLTVGAGYALGQAAKASK